LFWLGFEETTGQRKEENVSVNERKEENTGNKECI
jgi:hypothetical protein